MKLNQLKINMKVCVFIFYRDLRLIDNIAWNYCCKTFDTICPIFIYDENEWSSNNQRQFLKESLDELQISLSNFLNITTFSSVLKKCNNNYIFASNINNEYPDRYVKIKNKVEWIEFDDSVLIPTETFSKQRHPYKKFTPFYRYMSDTFKVQKPVLKTHMPKHLQKFSPEPNIHISYKPNNNVLVRGGYSNAIQTLQKFIKNGLLEYNNTRNCFSKDTSFLSAYLSLNVISIRQVYYATLKSEAFIRELYWREFYIHVFRFFPKVVHTNKKPKLTASQTTDWNKWKNGKTGICLVDACMNQLNTTGYMHNRGRMIVASYLIKNMKIPFQYGEEYFEKMLIDFNKASNNGGWQWVNGTGIDAQPKYQVFNPEIQRKKFDPNGLYIRKWNLTS